MVSTNIKDHHILKLKFVIVAKTETMAGTEKGAEPGIQTSVRTKKKGPGIVADTEVSGLMGIWMTGGTS